MRSKKRTSFRKRCIFACIGFFLSVLVIEAVMFVSYFILKGKIFSFQQYQTAMFNTAARLKNDSFEYADDINTDNDVIHPYLGFVHNPHRLNHISKYGFKTGGIDPILSRSSDKLIIGFFGGSFAEQIGEQAQETLKKILQPLHKEIIVLNLAIGGYKQPQQLLSLTYLLSLGAEFDVVITIDGFNEVALPPVENVPQGVFPLYPRSWYFKAAALDDPNVVTKLAQLETFSNARGKWADLFLRGYLHKSITACLLWRGLDKIIEKNINRVLFHLKNISINASNYLVTGPSYSFSTEDEFYTYLAAHWKRSSLQMKEICDMKHISFYHFLQPNQYYKDSKPMGPEELQQAIRDDQPYQKGVAAGYPYLRHYGQELVKQGVNFFDLTMLFSDIYEPLYADDCCHLNKKGYQMIIDIIGENIIRDHNIQNKIS